MGSPRIGIVITAGHEAPERERAFSTGVHLKAGGKPTRQIHSDETTPIDPEVGSDQLDSRNGLDTLETALSMGLDAQLIRVEKLESAIENDRFDACLLQLHGCTGGSGRVQKLLEDHAIPHSGPSSHVVRRCFDKIESRRVLSAHNLPIPTFLELNSDQADFRKQLRLLGGPAIAKPRFGAHSSGIRWVERAEEELRTSSGENNEILERVIRGSEFQTVLLDGKVLGTMQVQSGVCDNDQSFELAQCPPDIPASRLRGLEALALRASQVLGLQQHLCRVDMLWSERGNECILEVEAVPPNGRHSTVARVAHAMGSNRESILRHALQNLTLPAGASRRKRATKQTTGSYPAVSAEAVL